MKKLAMCNNVLVVFWLLGLWVCSVSASVSYDSKAITINGQRRILISGSIHYPRSSPEMWPDLIQKAKEGGLDVIQTYVFWNGHEPSPGKYYFEGNYDLIKFVKLVKQAGLYLHLRIGPYVCAEWNFGGLPVWLKYIPGINFRTDNGPFKAQMQKFTTKIVNMMKAEGLFESQGGPIILSQIENEYGPMEYELGAPGQAYTKWAANMAVGLGTGVPWVMCKQDDAPDPVINTCNGFYCDYFSPNKPYKPKMWTEAWTGWYTEFGGAVPYRPAEDLAFSVARFIQKGGSFINNYYMYHGGTNFGRTAGGPSLPQVMIMMLQLMNMIHTEKSWGAIPDCCQEPSSTYVELVLLALHHEARGSSTANVLASGLLRQPKWGHLKDLHRAIKLCEPALVSGDPAVIPLGNYQEAHVFKSTSGACAAFLANYNQGSFSRVAFGNMHYNLPPWSISILPDCKNTAYNTARLGAQSARMKMSPVPMHGGFTWQAYSEETDSEGDNTFTMVGLLEQINTTRDASDYLWYMTDVNIDPSEGFLKSGQYPVLTVLSAGHALHNVGPHFETWNAGILGPVTLNGLNEGRRDLSWQKWSYKIGLKGEALGLHSLSGSSSVEWAQGSFVSQRQPLMWYKTTFNAPAGNSPLAVDMDSMGKGQETFSENKCLSNCGEASQRWYHVPRSWLNPTGNLLVLLEEWGGDPNGISLVRRKVDSVCADIYEWQPTLMNYMMQASGKVNKPLRPKAHLACGPWQKSRQLSLLALEHQKGLVETIVKEAVTPFTHMMLLTGFVLGRTGAQ
ncbi:hypothetical protein GH714_019578 [Hevea brasiliensis]|uniref:Beta-galactosidase n=1 Tax=Hevea brasiliensis TaxID=3981 RepID=A0A6A6LLW4_HEVBR|nr:hypothetical protein GH714_019578 [Hevea brasiliensis]